MKKIINNILVIMAVFLMTSCAQTEFDVLPDDQLMGDSLQTTYTIDRLLSEFMVSEADPYNDQRTGTENTGLFTTNQIVSDNDVVISGVVTSTDIEGNVYKTLVIQETFKGGRALKVSIDAAGLSGSYPLGMRVWIRCNNLCIGKYAQSPVLGMKYINYEKYVEKTVIKAVSAKSGGKDTIVYDTSQVKVYRIEPGRIALPIARKVIHSYGLPDLTLVKDTVMTIAQIKAGGKELHGRLVRIKNAFFTGKGANNGVVATIKDNAQFIFAPSTDGLGYPQSREIQDGTGSLFVSTSEYAQFATKPLPTSNYRGEITAIVGFYNDKDVELSSSKIYHQLTLRRLSDLGAGFEGYLLINN